MDDKAASLLADLVGANVKSLAWTTDRIIENHEAQKRHLAEALLDIVQGLEKIPAMSRTVYVENLMYCAGPAVELAENIVEKEAN